MGRCREHHQFNVEIIGTQDPLAVLEILLLAERFSAALGSTGLSFKINSTDCPVCKPAHIETLVEYLNARYDLLAPVDRERRERNPLRVLDSKEPGTEKLLAAAPHTRVNAHLARSCGPNHDFPWPKRVTQDNEIFGPSASPSGILITSRPNRLGKGKNTEECDVFRLFLYHRGRRLPQPNRRVQ